MTTTRVRIGWDLKLLAEDAAGVELEGPTRLRPGRPIEIVLDAPRAGSPVIKRALVWEWTMVRAGRSGPTFRGFCRWT